MNAFLNDDILLTSDTAKDLYNVIKDDPIFDFHCHLEPKEIYEDKKFYNLTELWLDADHYKWRLMRISGTDESLITAKENPEERFYKFAESMEDAVGSPVYLWAQIELKKYFGITTPICRKSAKEIFERTQNMMSDGHISARNLIKQSNVEVIITTDDPLSDLKYHELLEKENLSFKVIPCFRMDNLYNIESDGFKDYIVRLSKMTGKTIETFENLIEAIKVRIDYFIKHSMVSTDISFKDIPFDASDVSNPTKSLELVFKGEELTEDDIETYHYMFLKEISKILKEKNIVMQWHVGVLRNQDSKEFVKHGRDIGRDSMGDPISVEDLNIILDDIEIEAGLPKITVYPLNPTNYYSVISSLLDYSKEVRGKLQLGAAWWFNDHENGIRAVLNAISDSGLLGVWNGMLTDSRSFTSYARHDYFRRILSSFIAEKIEKGEFPYDKENIERILHNISYRNAEMYFGGNK